MAEDPVQIDMDEMIAFIQQRLIANGFAVSDEAVALVLDAEMAFMEAKGLVEPIADEPEHNE